MVDLRTQLALCFGEITVLMKENEGKTGFTLDGESFCRWLSAHDCWFRERCGEKLYLLRDRELILSGEGLLAHPEVLHSIVNRAAKEGYAVKLQTDVCDCRLHWPTLRKLCESSEVIGLIIELSYRDAEITEKELEDFFGDIRAFNRLLAVTCPMETYHRKKLFASPALNSSDVTLFLQPEAENTGDAPAMPMQKCAGRMSLYVAPDGLVYPCPYLDRFPNLAVGNVYAKCEEELLQLGDELLEYMILGPDLSSDGPVIEVNRTMPWICRRHVAELLLRSE